MPKVYVTAEYGVEMDIGDVPTWVVAESLEKDGDFNIWEMPGKIKLEGVTVGEVPTKK